MKSILSAFGLPLFIFISQAAPMGTAFTYQGRLANATNAANGRYDFGFALYDAVTGGSQVGDPVALTGVGVANGVFTVTLDFGDSFDGSARWLGISVRTNGASSYTDLSPRQAISPTP
jgi:hypothetical protein